MNFKFLKIQCWIDHVNLDVLTMIFVINMTTSINIDDNNRRSSGPNST